MKVGQCSGHFTGSNHEYTLSEHTAVVYSTDWLHQNTRPPMEYAIPRTTRLFDTWKTCIAMNINKVLGISNGSNHNYTHSEPTIVTQSAE